MAWKPVKPVEAIQGNLATAPAVGPDLNLRLRVESAEARLDAAEAELVSLDSRLDIAEADIVALEAADVALDARLDTAEADIVALEAVDVALDTRLDVLEAVNRRVIDVNDATAGLRITQRGVGNAIEVEDSTTPDGSSFTVDQFGQVGIGTKTPVSSLDISTDGVGQITVGRHDNTLNPARFQSRKSQGTRAAPTLIGANGLLYEYSFVGYDGAAYQTAALIQAASEGTPAAGSMPGQLRFSTTPEGVVTAQERFRITASGLVVWGFKAGYGLGAGSGGAVTQLTSKSTGVTLNAATGQITMNAAALAANARVSFTVTNNRCEAADTIIIHRKSGGTAGTYSVAIDSVAGGSFVVSVWNYSATSRSEAVVLQFSILRGAIA